MACADVRCPRSRLPSFLLREYAHVGRGFDSRVIRKGAPDSIKKYVIERGSLRCPHYSSPRPTPLVR